MCPNRGSRYASSNSPADRPITRPPRNCERAVTGLIDPADRVDAEQPGHPDLAGEPVDPGLGEAARRTSAARARDAAGSLAAEAVVSTPGSGCVAVVGAGTAARRRRSRRPTSWCRTSRPRPRPAAAGSRRSRARRRRGRPQRVRGDLGEHGARAGADVDGADRDGVPAALEAGDPGGVAGHRVRRVGRGRDAGADPPVAVEGGAGARRARSAQPKRSAPRRRQSSSRRLPNGLPALGVDVGLVALAQQDRVDAAGDRELVHRDLVGEHARASRRARASTTGRRRRAGSAGGWCAGSARRTSSGSRCAVCSANSLTREVCSTTRWSIATSVPSGFAPSRKRDTVAVR